MVKNLIIAEPSEIIRKGLVLIIEGLGLFEKIREVISASGLEEAIVRYNPEVILINPSLTSKSFMDSLHEAGNANIKAGAIIYTLHDDEMISQFDELIMVNDTRGKIHKKITGLINKTPEARIVKPENTLSTRELDVLRLLVKGHSNKEISDKLFISTHTVISHRKNITQKLNIKSVAGLTVFAILNDIISIEDVN